MARDKDRDDLEHQGYRTGQIRIVGAEPAGRAAAARPEGEEPNWDDLPDEEDPDVASSLVPPLPHWTEPATGEVPAILSRDIEPSGADPIGGMRGPTWREEGSDWEAGHEEYEPSMLADQTGSSTLGASAAERQPWVFDLPGSKPESDLFGENWDNEPEGDWNELKLGTAPPAWADDLDDDAPITETLPVVGAEDDGPAADPIVAAPSVPVIEAIDEPEFEAAEEERPVFGAPGALDDGVDEPRSRFRSLRPSERRNRLTERSERSERPERAERPERPTVSIPARRPPADRLRPPPGPQIHEAPPRNVAAAIVSGIVLGAVALICFKVGPAPSVALVTLVVTMAAAEAFAAFRHGGYHPVTLLGLVATVSLMIATYNKGEVALPLVFVLLLLACFVWHLAGVEHTDAVRSIGTTFFIFGWIAVLGSFGALLLSPALFPNRHGIAFLLGGVIAAVAYDVGALTFGAWIGRHPMASVSPNKTWEGFFGGLLSSVIISVVILHLIHPWTVGKSAALAVVVSVVATLGDLFESTVKRHLGLKDMGRLLPGHGGLLDRVDGLLFVLPATYYLVIAFHLG